LIALELFHDQPWLVADGQILSLLAWGGLLAAAIGGVLAAVQSHFAPLMGYTALGDMGSGLVALALGNDIGLTIALLMIVARAVGLLLAGAGLAVMRWRVGGTSFAQVLGLGHRLPLATLSLLVGGLSLSGFPFTVGFAARWALLKQMSSLDGPWIGALVLAGAGSAIGWLRGAQILFTPVRDAPSGQRTPLVAGVIIVALVVLCFWLGHRSDWLLFWLRPLVDTFAPLV